ncbi:hypothetical protein Tco_0662342 [Tanacetum coccineum]
MHEFHQKHHSSDKWTKNHPIEQVIGDPSKPVMTRNRLQTDTEVCMYALTVSTIEPKNIKEAVLDASWIETMKDELSQFKRLDVWELLPNDIVKRRESILRSLLHQLRDLKLSEFYGIRGSQELSYLPNGRQNGIPKQSTERGRFVRHPDGFVDPDFPNHLYRLKKALYGLK